MSHAITRHAGAHHTSGHTVGGHDRGWSSLRRLGAWLGLSSGARGGAARSANRPAALDACAEFRRGEGFLQRWRQERVPVTVLVFELHDLPELECVFGVRAAHDAVHKAWGRLQRIAGTEGRVLRTDPTRFTVLLPDADRHEALDMLHSAFGESCSLEIEADGEDVLLVPDFAMRILSTETVPLVEVHHALCCEIQRTRTKEQRRQAYLQAERESHSRPMALPERPPAVRGEVYPRLPMTVPMPLALPRSRGRRAASELGNAP